MKTKAILITLIFLTMTLSNYAQESQSKSENNSEQNIDNSEKLVVVWTSGDKDVALKMVYMYTYNAAKNGWWKDVSFLIWGPSAKLLAEDKDLQEYLAKMKEVGIKLVACKACADSYGVSEKLTKIGVKVRYAGVELTNYIKENRHVVTF
jgi:hypothetical protein